MVAGVASTLLLSSSNLSDAGTLSENNVSPSDWLSGDLALSNLQNRQLTKVARSTNLAPDFDVTLVRDQSITMVALLNHNLTTLGQWRVQLSSVSDFSVIKDDSGLVDIWPTNQLVGSQPWGGFAYNGKVQESGGYMGLYFPSSPVFAKYIRITLSDSTNSLGYLQAGRVIIDTPWRPTNSAQFGWSLGHSKRSIKERSRGGQVWSDRKPEFRVLTFDLSGISEDEIYGQGYRVNNVKGVTGDVFAILDPDDLTNRHRYAIYGTQIEPGQITNQTHKAFGQPFSIEESL